jgi:hypothetical protein
VKLLRAAMIVFKSWTAKVGICADSVLTLPSLASTYAWLQGAYEGVCRYSRVLRAYLSSAVYGGRVMVRNNEPIIVEGDIANVDAVSLYPSAMRELQDALLQLLCGHHQDHCHQQEVPFPLDLHHR